MPRSGLDSWPSEVARRADELDQQSA